MKTWSFYDPASGVFTGARFSGPERALQANTPKGMMALEGAHDALRSMLDVVSGEVIARPQLKPDDDWSQTWRWDEGSAQWVSVKTPAAVAADVRFARDTKLAACDWVSIRAADTGTAVPQDWAQYRQALRDVTQQDGFPMNVVWPNPPA